LHPSLPLLTLRHPEAIAVAAREKRLLIKTKPGRKVRVPLYEHVYVIDYKAPLPRTRATEY
jgi:hypothetical protein